ncbi:efflux RND transporter periplasmic adaptor subunit [Clostridium sediminicola]|uniref:efflux RND transporter periplasmic adaptor subunit n=1 Tax=Clostridium sediminicola TaxID=3114879 RepID=UPI0031F26696
MKKFIRVLVVILLVGIIAVPRVINLLNSDKSSSENNDEIAVVAVSGQQVLQGEISNHVMLIGSTKASDSVDIIPEIPAKVKKVNVEVGDYVKKGKLLFGLDASSAQDQVTQANIGITMAEVGVKNANEAIGQAEIGYELAKSNYEMQLDKYELQIENLAKYEILLKEGIVTEAEVEQMRLQASPENINLLEKQLEQAEASVNQAKIGKESAEASLKKAQEGLRTANDMLGDMSLEAPTSGYVSAINVTENNFASNAQPAITIENIDEIIINANVTESYVNKLSIGDEVSVIIESLDNLELTGTIDTLSTSADARTLLFPLTVKIKNEEHTIKPGMFATVDFVAEESLDTLYVPSDAVLLRDGVHYVYIQSEDNKVERREVTIGIDTGYFIEILEGVTADDVVITKGLGLIDEDSVIKVIRSDQ